MKILNTEYIRAAVWSSILAYFLFDLHGRVVYIVISSLTKRPPNKLRGLLVSSPLTYNFFIFMASKTSHESLLRKDRKVAVYNRGHRRIKDKYPNFSKGIRKLAEAGWRYLYPDEPPLNL